MTQQKMIINRSLYCNWRFEGCGDDWDDFIDSYGFSPQFLIDGKTINDVSLDDVFWDCGYMYNNQIENLKELDTPENRKKYGDDFFDYEGVEIAPTELDFELVWEGED
tara:strand:+ start:228 stop:551 length:324 start_codon:yes stop_codon:yes gene_type:complete